MSLPPVSASPLPNVPVPNQPPAVANAGNGVEQQPVAPGVQPPQPQQEPGEQQQAARPLAQRLDNILIRASALATRSADAAAVKDAVAQIPLKKDERAAISAAAEKARQTLSTLAKFTGRQIAAAMTAGPDGSFDWNDGAAAKAVRDAIDAQTDLADILHSLANRPDVNGSLFDSVCELALQCDRRQSEISTLAIQLAVAVASGDDPKVNERLDATVSSLLPRQALSMHGNEAAIEKLREKLEPLADRLDAFASRPGASLSNAEFMGYAIELADAAAALERAAREGFPTDDGGRVMPDRSLLEAALKFVAFAREKLEDARGKIGGAYLDYFAKNTLGVSDDFAILYEENLGALGGSFPNLAHAASMRHRLGEVAREYARKPTKDGLQTMQKLARMAAEVDDMGLRKELERLRKAVKTGGEGEMTKADMDALVASFIGVSATDTQVAHFVQMVKCVKNDLSPEQFFSTTSARALVEGRLPFTTLVEARVHGMADADIDPDLDDSRMDSTRQLGAGNANTVYLVTYKDGRECVFKPEAPGRQGMDLLTLSQDYRAEQQVANLNLATQDAAKALGLAGLVPKCSVGSHQGQYGLFMEKAPGVDGTKFVDGNAAPGHLNLAQIKALPEDKYRLVTGRIMRELNRLQWLDIVTGQGDRHRGNYFVAVRADLTVTVTGIDNDQCFTGYRTGAQTYVVRGAYAAKFRKVRAELANQYPGALRGQIAERYRTDPGVKELGGGVIRLEPSKFRSQELHYAARSCIGMHGATMPDFIDEELYDSIVALKAGPARDAYLADLSRRLPPEAVEAAASRLDEAIAHAERLRTEGKVVAKDDFSRADVQKRLLARDLAVPANPIRPVGGHVIDNQKIVSAVRRQNLSLFARDLMRYLDRGFWRG